MWDSNHLRLEAFIWRAATGEVMEVMEVMGRDGDVQACAWMNPCLFCRRKSNGTSHMKFLWLISLLKYKYFFSSFSLGPGVPIPAMRLEENKVNVARSHLSDMPPRSVPAVHLSEMALCVSLKATILCASMNDSIYLALLLDHVLWHRWQRR